MTNYTLRFKQWSCVTHVSIKVRIVGNSFLHVSTPEARTEYTGTKLTRDAQADGQLELSLIQV